MLVLQIQNGLNPKSSQQIKIPVLVDTGFNSYLSIPHSLVKKLNLKIDGETEVELANGQQYTVYVGLVNIKLPDFDTIFEIEAIFGEDQEALLGTKTLDLIASKFGIDFDKSELFFEGLKIEVS
jgi:clan AA aspartic protease